MGGCCVGDFPVIREIKEFVSDLFCSDSGCGYHPGSNENERHAKKIADELAEMKERIWGSTEKSEKKLLDYINRDMETLLTELEKLNYEKYGGESLHINIKGIKDENEQLKRKVKGHIGNIMDERLVLKDKELSLILEERDDKKRAKNFDSFVQRVRKQAIESLLSSIQDTVRKQSEVIHKEIQTRLNQVNERMDEAQRDYDSIIQAKNSKEGELEARRMEHIYQCELFQILKDQLGG